MVAKNKFLELNGDGLAAAGRARCRGGIVASTRKPDKSPPRQCGPPSCRRRGVNATYLLADDALNPPPCARSFRHRAGFRSIFSASLYEAENTLAAQSYRLAR